MPLSVGVDILQPFGCLHYKQPFGCMSIPTEPSQVAGWALRHSHSRSHSHSHSQGRDLSGQEWSVRR
jgi:hypothetical protein